MLASLLIVIVLAAILFGAVLLRAAIAERAAPNPEAVVLGAIVSFFDTLGIGSFAPTTAWMKFRRLVPDRLIPPTMLVGLTPPVFAESIIFLSLIKVDPVLLVGCAVAVLVGGLVGAPLVTRARTWVIQIVVAVALVLAAIAYAATNLDKMPGGGTAEALPLALTIAAIGANFVFGILLNFGVGNYAPTLVTLSLMGMNPRLIFPIMAAGAAVMGAGACVRHIQMRKIDLRVVVGLGLGGIPAVLAAALIVKSMPLTALRWLVIVVVLYAAAVMLRSAMTERRSEQLTPEEAAAAS
jgi:uncharacterized membrane protein YfcA